jgi:hypothetical protein
MPNNDDALRAALWNMCQEHYTQGRHHETQRAGVVSAILAIATALTGLVTFDKTLSSSDLPMTLGLILLGVFGFGFSMKQYERFRLHMARAREYRNALDALLPGSPLRELKRRADTSHETEFRGLEPLRLHYWWASLNLFVAALGVVLTVYALA